MNPIFHHLDKIVENGKKPGSPKPERNDVQDIVTNQQAKQNIDTEKQNYRFFNYPNHKTGRLAGRHCATPEISSWNNSPAPQEPTSVVSVVNRDTNYFAKTRRRVNHFIVTDINSHVAGFMGPASGKKDEITDF